MAQFNPETVFEVPFLANRSQGAPPDRSGETLMSGFGDLISGGVKAAENIQERKIESELIASRDQLMTEFGINQSIDTFKDAPQGVKRTAEQMKVLQAQLAQGVIEPFEFHARAGALVSQVRDKYPRWRAEVDQMTKTIFGFDPANQVVNDLISNASSAASAQDRLAARLFSEIYNESNQKRISIDPYLQDLDNQWRATGYQDNEIGQKLHKALIGATAEEAYYDRRQRQREDTAHTREQAVFAANEEANDRLREARQRTTISNLQVFAEKLGITEPVTSLYELLIQVQKDGITMEEQQILGQIQQKLLEDFNTAADSIAAIEFNWAEGPQSLGSLAKDFDTSRQKEYTQLATTLNDAFNPEKNNWAPLAYDATLAKLMQDQQWRSLVSRFPILLNFGKMSQVFGEDFMNLWVKQIMANPDKADNLTAFMRMLTGALTGDPDALREMTDNGSMPGTTRWMENKDTGDVPATREQQSSVMKEFLGIVGGVTRGDLPEGLSEQGARNMAVNFYENVSPSELLKHVNSEGESVQIVLESLVSPDQTQWMHENFNGTRTWTKYKNFVVDSFLMLPANMRINNNVRAFIERWGDKALLVFDEKTFKMSAIVKDPKDQAAMDSVMGNAWFGLGRQLDAFNRYFRLLEPIAEAEGKDATEFLREVFSKMRFLADEKGVKIHVLTDMLEQTILDHESESTPEEQGQTQQEAPEPRTEEEDLIEMQPSPASFTLDASDAVGQFDNIDTFDAGLARLITSKEVGSRGGYNTLFEHAEVDDPNSPGYGMKVSEMTVDEVIALQRKLASYNKRVHKENASPAGAFQIVGRTLRFLKETLGLTGDEIFSPELQNKLFVVLADGAGLQDYKDGKITEKQFIARLGNEWKAVKVNKGLQGQILAYLNESAQKKSSGVEEARKLDQSRIQPPIPRPRPSETKELRTKMEANASAIFETEFELELQPYLDNVARLGFDASKAKVADDGEFNVKGFYPPLTMTDKELADAQYDYRRLLNREPMQRGVAYVATDAMEPSIWAHEFRHRGYDLIRKKLVEKLSDGKGNFDKAKLYDLAYKIKDKTRFRPGGVPLWFGSYPTEFIAKQILRIANKDHEISEEKDVAYMDRHGSSIHDILVGNAEVLGEPKPVGHLPPEGTEGAGRRTKELPVIASHIAQMIMDGEF